MIARLLLPMSMLSLLSVGAIFGFFYAWVCSTMWGLDAADPKIAIAAMQAMNASVRNVVFFPIFFATPLLLIATAILALTQNRRRPAILFGAGAAVYLGGAFLITALFNVPMNDALAKISIPTDGETARRIWQTYSTPWQNLNIVRTLASGAALMLTGFAVLHLDPKAR